VDNGWLDDKAESLIKVNTRSLSETTEDPTSLVALQRTVGMKLLLEDPLDGDGVCSWGMQHKVPSGALQQGTVLFRHSSLPIRIGKGTAEGLQHW